MTDSLPTRPERLFADTQWLQRVARQLVRDPGAAEDLVQDTWLAALRYRGRAILNRRAWLRSLLFNRHVSARRRAVARESREELVARPEALPSSAELCERAELQRVMGEALLELEEPYRTTALLRFLEGLAPAEIAERQGVPVNTVRWRLRRSVEGLRERLDREVGSHWGVALLALLEPNREALTAGTLQAAATLGTTIMIKKTLLIASALVALILFVVHESEDADVLPSLTMNDEPMVEWPKSSQSEDPEALARGDTRREVVRGENNGETSVLAESAVLASATIIFEAVSREHGRPLAGVAAMPEVRGRALVPYQEAKKKLTDAFGELRYEVPANEVIHVQAWGEDPPAGLAVLDLDPLEAGAERRVRLELPTMVDIFFFGRVVDEESGEPLAGIRVNSRGPSGIPAAIEEAATDEDGVFELRVPSWRTAYFNATGEGRGRISFRPTSGHDQRGTALELSLPRSAAVEGQVESNEPVAEGTRVVLDANNMDVQRPRPERLIQYSPESWDAEVDASGQYRIDGLNAGARFRAKLLVDGLTVREFPEELVLQVGETRVLDWQLGPRVAGGASIAGGLVDQEGVPIVDRELWILRANRHGESRFHSNSRHRALLARTDLDGQFKVRGLEAGLWSIGPGVVEAGPGSRVTPWAITVELEPGEERRDVRLTSWRDLVLRGRVLDEQGLAVAGCSVRIDATDLGRRSVRTNEQGNFEALGLRPVEYNIGAGGMDAGYARSQTVTVKPNGGTIVLELGPSGMIRGRVLGDTGLGGLGIALISARQPKNPQDDWMMIGVRVDGYFSMDGLTPGIYDVFVSRKDGRCGLVAGHRVEAGPGTKELEVELSSGAELTPRVAGNVSLASYRIFAGDAYIAYGNCDREESETHLVPPGRIEVRYRTGAGVEGSTYVDVHGGEQKAVQLH